MDYKFEVGTHGYLFMDRNGGFSHRIRSLKSLAGFLSGMSNSFLSTLGVLLLPRSLLPYGGVISWFREEEGSIYLHALITRRGASHGDVLRLTGEFERLAKVSGARTISTQTHVNPRVMRRMGFEPIGEVRSSDFLSSYEKAL